MASSSKMVSENSENETIEDLTKEVEMLKQKLEEERAKFHDVECRLAFFACSFELASVDYFQQKKKN
jgi:hypothetical protein